MNITWFGTASLSISTEKTTLLIDPFLPLPGARNRVEPEAFKGCQNILITHGHFDHIASLPEIVQDRNTRVYCTRTPEKTLIEKGIGKGQLCRIQPENRFQIDDIYVTVFQSRHVQFDWRLLLRTFLNFRIIRYSRNLPWILRENAQCRENGEIVGFLLEADQQSIYVMGSLNMDSDVCYPSGMDVLVLPYQGTTDLINAARKVIDRMKPRTVFADHFDDAFPPLSNDIRMDGLRQTFQNRITVIVPEPGKSYSVSKLIPFDQ